MNKTTIAPTPYATETKAFACGLIKFLYTNKKAITVEMLLKKNLQNLPPNEADNASKNTFFKIGMYM